MKVNWKELMEPSWEVIITERPGHERTTGWWFWKRTKADWSKYEGVVVYPNGRKMWYWASTREGVVEQARQGKKRYLDMVEAKRKAKRVWI